MWVGVPDLLTCVCEGNLVFGRPCCEIIRIFGEPISGCIGGSGGQLGERLGFFLKTFLL